MKIITTNAGEIVPSVITEMNVVACKAFGQSSVKEMLEDTRGHIQAAEQVQLAYVDEVLVGFALYRRCLWQHSA